jgi:neutral trehalase
MSIFNKIRSAFIGTGVVPPAKSSPDELLGELFQDVQLRRVYPDGMTFVDMVPANRLRKILVAYERQRSQPNFDLHEFVRRYFKDYLEHAAGVYKTNPKHTVEQHINELWNVLTRQAYTPCPIPTLCRGVVLAPSGIGIATLRCWGLPPRAVMT